MQSTRMYAATMFTPRRAGHHGAAGYQATGMEIQVAGADAYGEMLDQFAAVVNEGVAPLWGAAESQLLARWIDALHHSAV
jgi:hypothetical protein